MGNFKTIIQSSTGNLPGDITLGIDQLLQTSGVAYLTDDSFLVSERASGGANMSVDIAAGRAVVQNSGWVLGDGDQKFYVVRLDAVENVTINANGAGNPRITSLFIKIDKSASDSVRGEDASSVVAVDGTAAASPSAPSAPADGNDYYRIANVTVANLASSITDANITDTRTEALLRNDIYDEPVLTNDKAYKIENASGTATDAVGIDSSNVLTLGADGLSGVKLNGVTVGRAFYNGFTDGTALNNLNVIKTFNVPEAGDYYIRFAVVVGNTGATSTVVRFFEVRLYDNTTSGTQLAGALASIEANAGSGGEYASAIGATDIVTLDPSDDVVLEFRTSAADGVCQLVNNGNQTWVEFIRVDYETQFSLTVT